MVTERVENIIQEMHAKAAGKAAFGAIAKIDLGDDGVFWIDGRGENNVIQTEPLTEDATLILSYDTFLQIRDGSLDGMSAYFQGNLIVEGDQMVAMRLGELIES